MGCENSQFGLEIMHSTAVQKRKHDVMQLSYKQYTRKAIVYCIEVRLQTCMLLIRGVKIRQLWAESLCGYQREMQTGVIQGDSVVFPSLCQGRAMSSWFSQCDNQVWLASRNLLKLILADLASRQCWWGCSSSSGVQEGSRQSPCECPVSPLWQTDMSLGAGSQSQMLNGSKCLDCTSLVNLQWLLLQITDITQSEREKVLARFVTH